MQKTFFIKLKYFFLFLLVFFKKNMFNRKSEFSFNSYILSLFDKNEAKTKISPQTF